MFVVTTHGKLFLAPIGDNPKNILDIATGLFEAVKLTTNHTNQTLQELVSGRSKWVRTQNPMYVISVDLNTCNQTAQLFPNAQVTGTDLSPIQPQ